MKKALRYALAVYLTALLLAPGYLVIRHYDTLLTGEDFKFIVEPYDPYDPFRGRYVAFTASQVTVPPDGDSDYAILRRDERGFGELVSWSDTRPREGAYAKGLELRRYYMNENLAPEAERIQRELGADELFYVLVKVKGGNYVIEGLYLNDIPIEQYIAD